MATTRENGLIARENGLVKGLGLIDSTTLVMGSMIGSGVFIVAADISRQVQSPGLMMMTWFVTAALTLRPLVAIGGITWDNAPICWNAGADSVAVIADIFTTPCSRQALRHRMSEWQKLAETT